MKALILAGGKGTRFMEETDTKPKPMIEVNGTPIIFHIIDHYSTHGISEIYILAGYKKEYFINYFRNNKYNEKDGGFCFNTKTNVFVAFSIFISPIISSPILEDPINFISSEIVTQILFSATLWTAVPDPASIIDAK